MGALSRVEVLEWDQLTNRIEELEAAGRRVAYAHMYDREELDGAIIDLASTLGMSGDG